MQFFQKTQLKFIRIFRKFNLFDNLLSMETINSTIEIHRMFYWRVSSSSWRMINKNSKYIFWIEQRITISEYFGKQNFHFYLYKMKIPVKKLLFLADLYSQNILARLIQQQVLQYQESDFIARHLFGNCHFTIHNKYIWVSIFPVGTFKIISLAMIAYISNIFSIRVLSQSFITVDTINTEIWHLMARSVFAQYQNIVSFYFSMSKRLFVFEINCILNVKLIESLYLSIFHKIHCNIFVFYLLWFFLILMSWLIRTFIILFNVLNIIACR